jgi:adenylate cyclase
MGMPRQHKTSNMQPSIKEDAPWPELNRVRRAIVVIDVVESVRLMQADDADTIDRWRRLVHSVRVDVLPRFAGRMVKSLGDGMLLEFATVTAAVDASLHVQALAAAANTGRPSASMMWLRVGLHVGDIVADELDIYGSAVNIAERIAAFAEPGGIVASAEARDEITAGLQAEVDDLGDCYLKHIESPVRCFRLGAIDRAAPAPDPASPTAATSLLPVIAVLPLRSLRASERHRAVGDALADHLIAALSRRRDWRVVSRLSTVAFRAPGADASLETIRKTVNAGFVVDGSYSVANGRLSARFEVNHAVQGCVLWAGSATMPLSALFAGDDDALAEVVTEIGRSIDGSELRRVGCLPLPTLESYSLYLGGTHLLNRLTPQDFNRSRDIFQHVSERVPRAASPQAMLAKWHVLRMTQGWAQDANAEGLAARACASRALQLEPHHAYALAVDGLVATQVDGDLKLAKLRHEAAIDADPQEPYAWAALSGVCAYTDDVEAAEAAAYRALGLSPLDPARFMYEANLAVALVSNGRHQEAIEAARRSLRLNRSLTGGYRILAVAQVLADKVEDARHTVRTLLALEPQQTLTSFQRRFPGRDSRLMPSYLEALRIAGVPA